MFTFEMIVVSQIDEAARMHAHVFNRSLDWSKNIAERTIAMQ